MCRIVHAFDFVNTLQYVSFQNDSLHINQPSSLSLNVTTICYQPSAINLQPCEVPTGLSPGQRLKSFLRIHPVAVGRTAWHSCWCLSQRFSNLMIFYQFWAPKKRRLLNMKNKNCWKISTDSAFILQQFSRINSHVLYFFYTKELDNFRNSFHQNRFRASTRFFFTKMRVFQ